MSTRKNAVTKNRMLPEHATLLQVKLSGTNLNEVLNIIEFRLRKKEKTIISTPNPEIVLQAQKSKNLRKALNTSDIAIPDGVGLLWAARQLHFPLKLQRIPGRVLMEALFSLANRKKYKVFLLGASGKTNQRAVSRLKRDFPNIKVAGTAAITVDESGKASDGEVVQQINRFKPHLLFVALGAPKQELWITHHGRKVEAGVFMAVGGSLDYFANTKPLPPALVSRVGFEWLWRLLTQPTRIGRIFDAVIRFPLLVLRSK